MVLLGANPTGRVVEQHDYYFGIAENLQQLVANLKAFWPEAGNTLHIDGWREINYVDEFKITVAKRPGTNCLNKQLFFLNLGGYTANVLEEQHYTLLCVRDNAMDAVKYAKSSSFFKTNQIKTVKGAASHIDEKYGIDVDEFFRVDDLLTDDQKALYAIEIQPAGDVIVRDQIHLGYLRLDKLQLK